MGYIGPRYDIRGSRHHLAKLTEEDVLEMRAEWADRENTGATYEYFSAKYGISRRTVWMILSRRTWKWL